LSSIPALGTATSPWEGEADSHTELHHATFSREQG